jgi:hypothetical protein
MLSITVSATTWAVEPSWCFSMIALLQLAAQNTAPADEGDMRFVCFRVKLDNPEWLVRYTGQ